MNIVCLDIETTGLSRKKDEVLQLSLIDGNYNILFDTYLRPVVKESWYYAQQVHGITPKMVEDKECLNYYKSQIEGILNSAKLLVGYNLKTFDLPFLKEQGIYIDETIPVFDVMKEFSRINRSTNVKLIECAKYFGYEFNAHNSLEDTKATLHCYYEMLKQ